MRYLAVVLCFFPVLCYAQRGVSAQWQPELSFNFKTDTRWQFNLRVVGFNTFTAPSPEGTVRDYRFNHAEFLLFATYGLDVRSAFSVGYLYRIRDPFEDNPGYEHRLIQQINFISNIERFRLGHRLRSEQRIRDNGFSQRFRYRISLDFPLSGEVLDLGELYLVAAEEVLWSLNGGVPDRGENRFSLGPGFFFNRQVKLETMLQYRLSNIALRNKYEPVEHAFILLTTLMYNF